MSQYTKTVEEALESARKLDALRTALDIVKISMRSLKPKEKE